MSTSAHKLKRVAKAAIYQPIKAQVLIVFGFLFAVPAWSDGGADAIDFLKWQNSVVCDVDGKIAAGPTICVSAISAYGNKPNVDKNDVSCLVDNTRLIGIDDCISVIGATYPSSICTNGKCFCVPGMACNAESNFDILDAALNAIEYAGCRGAIIVAHTSIFGPSHNGFVIEGNCTDSEEVKKIEVCTFTEVSGLNIEMLTIQFQNSKQFIKLRHSDTGRNILFLRDSVPNVPDSALSCRVLTSNHTM